MPLVDCPKCGGSGGGPDPVLYCRNCQGFGSVCVYDADPEDDDDENDSDIDRTPLYIEGPPTDRIRRSDVDRALLEAGRECFGEG